MRGLKSSLSKFLTGLAVFLFVFFIPKVNSDKWSPFVVCLVSLAWLGFFVCANYKREDESEDEENRLDSKAR